MTDIIIKEIREFRDEYARQFNYDLHQMCLDLRRAQELSGATIVSFSANTIRPEFVRQGGQGDTHKAGSVPSQD